MESYILNLKDKITNKSHYLKDRCLNKRSVAKRINSYFSKEKFEFFRFINDDGLINDILFYIDDKKLKQQFSRQLEELKKMPLTEILASYNDDLVKEKKVEFLKVLRNITNSFLNTKYYKNIDNFLSIIDKINVEVVEIDDYFIKFLDRMGLNENEILEFMTYVSKANMKLYKKKMDKIKQAELDKELNELEKEMKKEERKRNKNLMSKNMSLHTSELLENIKSILDDNELEINELDFNMANAYKEILLDDPMSLLNDSISAENVSKYLLILIKNLYDEIEMNKNKHTENELSKTINLLSKLYLKWLGLNSKDLMYEDEQKEDLLHEENINVYFVIDEKNNNSYYLNSLNNARKDEAFVRNAENIIDKMKKGIYLKKTKKSFDGIDNCFYVQQGLTYVSFIMINDNNFMVLNASKWNDLYSSTRNIYNNNSDQIMELKKRIAGDIL